MAEVRIPAKDSQDPALRLAGSGRDVRVVATPGSGAEQIIGDGDDIILTHGNLDLGDLYVLAGTLEKGEIAGRVSPDHDMIVLDTSGGNGSQFAILELPAATALNALRFGDDFSFIYNNNQYTAKIHSWVDNADFAPELNVFGQTADYNRLSSYLTQSGFVSTQVRYDQESARAVVRELASDADFRPIGATLLPGTPVFFDEMLIAGSDGKFYHVVLPLSADPVSGPEAEFAFALPPAAEGESAREVKGKIHRVQISNTMQSFLYQAGDNVVYQGPMNVSGMRVDEGTIRRVENQADVERFFALAGPFDESFLIQAKTGQFFVVTLPADFATQFKDWAHLRPFKDVNLRDLDITYTLARPDGSTSTALLSGSIYRKSELDDKTPVNVTSMTAEIVDPQGNPVTNRHDQSWLRHVLEEDNPFFKSHDYNGAGFKLNANGQLVITDGDFLDKISYAKFSTKKTAIVNKLERVFFDVEVKAEWDKAAAAPLLAQIRALDAQIAQAGSASRTSTRLIQQRAALQAQIPVTIHVRVTTPPRTYTFGEAGKSEIEQMIGMVDLSLFGDATSTDEERIQLRAAWASDPKVQQSLLELRKDLAREVISPIDHDAWEKTLNKFKKVSRKSDDFEVINAGIDGLDASGRAIIGLAIRPKPKDFAITFTGANGQTQTWTMKDVGLNPDKPIGEDKFLGLINNYAKKAKQFYDAVSKKLASQNPPQIFAVEVPNADGSGTHMEPYVPKIRSGLMLPGGKTPDALRGSIDSKFCNMFFAAGANGEVLPIRTLRLPTKLDVSGLPADMQPGKARLERLFNDKKKGHYTSESIFHGIATLTRWYSAKGYPLRGGHLDYSIDDQGVLHVKASLYKVKSNVEVIVPEVAQADIDALDAQIQAEKNPQMQRTLQEKKEALIAWRKMDADTKRKIQNEFTLGKGDTYNVKKFYRSIQEVQNRYHVFLIPSEIKDEKTGEVTLRVVALQKNAADVLNFLNVGAGVAASDDGIGPTAQVSFDSQLGKVSGPGTGHLLGASVSGIGVPSDGGMNMGGGANLSINGPADAQHGRHSVAVDGTLNPNWVSSVGAGWKYRRPIGDSNWSVGPEVGVKMPFGEGIEGTGVPYFRAGVGASYDDMNGLTAGISTGINVAPGFVFGDVSAGIHKRWNLSDDETVYAEAYAKAGVLFGNVPAAALFGSSPYMGWAGIGAGNAFMQGPISIYAMVGAAIMKEVVDENGFGLDIGLGANAGGNGALWSAGVGVRFKLRLGGININLTVGPSIVNGVPTLLGISFD